MKALIARCLSKLFPKREMSDHWRRNLARESSRVEFHGVSWRWPVDPPKGPGRLVPFVPKEQR